MKNDNPLIALFKSIKRPKLLIVITLFITSIGSLSGLLIPLFTGRLVDDFSFDQITSTFVIAFVSIFMLNAIFSGLGLYLLNKIGEKIIFYIRTMLWEHFIKLPITFFDDNESGNLMSRLTDDTKVINQFISFKLPGVFPALLTIIGSIIILFVLDWQMTLVIFLIFPIYLLIMMPLGRIMQKISIQTQTEIANFSGLLGRVLTEIRLVKISNMEDAELKNAESILTSIYGLGLKQAKVSAIIQPASSIVMLLTVGIILGFGGVRVSSGEMSAGTLVAMIFYIFQLSMPLVSISTLITDYKRAVGASSRVHQILQEPIENFDKFNESLISDGDLIFDDVNFSYGDKSIIKNISFVIPENKVTAIVGPSGSGKTTIFNLIERMYKIEYGKILYNNKSIYDFPLSLWRKKIGYVMQGNPMMNTTIKDNIMYGLENEISKYELERISKSANCHDFIANLKEGYNTVIGERGVRLSGGQKQRIDIARVFAKKPDLVLLDEATSSLDSESEGKIQSSLDLLMNGRTTIVIAHRLSTVKKADQIIFLDEGTITGRGSHEHLVKNHEKYKSFVTNQALKD